MPVLPVPQFLEMLEKSQLLDASQLEEIRNSIPAEKCDITALGKLIHAQGWLTRLQISLLANGKEVTLGPYRLLDRIGEGGMGTVYKAQDLHLDRIVALKVIRKQRLTKPDAVKRFQREVQATAGLVHPNFVAAYAALEVNGTHLFAMEYVEGTNLSLLVREIGPLPVGQACDYIRQAACGLAYAHGRGLIHRDIKPSNLLLASGGREPPVAETIKILDLGLALLHGTGETDTALTQEGSVVGSPDYLPPEQAVDSHAADVRSDVYSLGCTLYFLLTGRPPFHGGTMAEVLLKHQMEACVPIEKLRPDVPPGVAAIVRRAMAKQPGDRFRTAADLAEALAPFCDGAGDAAAPGSVMDRPLSKGRKWGLLLAGLSTAAGLVAALIFLQRPGTSEPSVPTQPIVNVDPFKGAYSGLTKDIPPDTSPVHAALTLASLQDAMVPAGESLLLTVSIERRGFQGPVSVAVHGLPGEVSALPCTIDADASTGSLRLEASAKASDSRQRIEVVATAGELAAWGLFELSVKQAAVVTKPPEPPPPPVRVAKKLLLPSPEQQAEASKRVREVYKQDFSKKGTVERLNLAAKLLVKGSETKDDPTARFVLFSEALDLAAETGDTPIALVAIDELERDYEVDAVALKVTALTGLSRSVTTPTPSRALAEAALAAMDDALAADQFEAAAKLLALAQTAIKKSSTPALAARCEARRLDLPEYQKDFTAFQAAAARLKDKGGNPADPEDSLVMGKYLCFRKADWDRGLPLLAAGNNAALQALAKKDLARPSAANARVELGDGWWALAEAEVAGSKLNLQRRAAYWYHQVEPGVKGLTRDRIELRLKVVQDQAPGVRSLEVALGQRRLDGHKGKVTCVLFLPDNQRVLTGGDDQTVRLWDIRTGKELGRYGPASGPLVELAVSQSGKRLLACTASQLYLWETESRKTLNSAAAGTTVGAAFAALDGGRIVYANPANGTGFLWAYEVGAAQVPVATKLTPTCLASSADGRLGFFGSKDGLICVWDLEKQKELTRLKGHTGEVVSIAVSRDGRSVVSAGSDKTVRMWDAVSATEIRRFRGHTGLVASVALSADGRRVLGGGEDKIVHLWDARSGQELRRFSGHTDKITSVSASPDGTYVVSGSADQTARVWDVTRQLGVGK